MSAKVSEFVTLILVNSKLTKFIIIEIRLSGPKFKIQGTSLNYLVKHIFLSEKIVHKISFSLCFRAPDPIIDKFHYNQSKNRTEAQNKRLNKIL